MLRQATVTVYLKSKQLPSFVFALSCRHDYYHADCVYRIPGLSSAHIIYTIYTKQYRFIRMNLLPGLRTAHINPFKPEFTIVSFIHYKPRIAVAILDL